MKGLAQKLILTGALLSPSMISAHDNITADDHLNHARHAISTALSPQIGSRLPIEDLRHYGQSHTELKHEGGMTQTTVFIAKTPGLPDVTVSGKVVEIEEFDYNRPGIAYQTLVIDEGKSSYSQAQDLDGYPKPCNFANPYTPDFACPEGLSQWVQDINAAIEQALNTNQ